MSVPYYPSNLPLPTAGTGVGNTINIVPNGLSITPNDNNGDTMSITPTSLIVNDIPIDPLNLTAVAPNQTPLYLNIVDTLGIASAETNPDYTLTLQTRPTGVGSFFGLDYESTTSENFIIQSTSSGSIQFQQIGLGATTQQLILNPTQVFLKDTANNYTTDITNTSISLVNGLGDTNAIAPTSQVITNNSGDTNTQTATSMNITDSASSGNSSYSYNGISINGTAGTFSASTTQVKVQNGSSLAVLDNGSGSYGGVIGLIASNGTNQTEYTPTGITLSSTNLNIQGGNLNMDGNSIEYVDNLACNTINGFAPTTIGLVWSDFNGSNAYNNLPNNSYQVANNNITTTQSFNNFNIYNSNDANSTELEEGKLSTTNSILTLTGGSGSFPIDFVCSYLTLNGQPIQFGSLVYSVPSFLIYLNNATQSSGGSSINILQTGNYQITYSLFFTDSNFYQTAGGSYMIKGWVGLTDGSSYYYPNSYTYAPSAVLSYDNTYHNCITATDTIYINNTGTFYLVAQQENQLSQSGQVVISATLVKQ